MHDFNSIDNFRDIAESVQQLECISSGVFYRSATLDFATEDDLEKLVSMLKVNTILDLRSELEAQMSLQGKPFLSFPVAVAMKLKPSDMTEPDHAVSVKETSEGPTRKTIMINFAGRKFRKNAVWNAAPIKIKMQIAGLMAAGQKPKAVKLVGEEVISKKGLIGLYKDFIDYCDQEICSALQILADTRHYPILVHCTQGKDRTGLVTALALAAVGVEEEKIIEDYGKSRSGLARVLPDMVKEMGKNGLDPTFADAPPEVMRETFVYIRDKYISVESYLTHIGFDRRMREHLKRALLFKIASAPETTFNTRHATHPTFTKDHHYPMPHFDKYHPPTESAAGTLINLFGAGLAVGGHPNANPNKLSASGNFLGVRPTPIHHHHHQQQLGQHRSPPTHHSHVHHPPVPPPPARSSQLLKKIIEFDVHPSNDEVQGLMGAPDDDL